jgi:FtsZ-binding cell division protein ZapB
METGGRTMSDERTVVATPAEMLEARIMDPNAPKTEAEHWAVREIERLREELSWATSNHDNASLEVERLRVENEELRKERDTAQANLFSLRFHFENWKVYNGTYVKEMQIEELRAEVERLRAALKRIDELNSDALDALEGKP